MKSITPGRYRHYKGNDYEVVGLARHSETEEYLVLYRPLYEIKADTEASAERGQTDLWVRPLQMFRENVLVAGAEVPRFRYLEPEKES